MAQPHIVRLFGEITEDSARDFVDAVADAPDVQDLLVELTSVGGDAECARRAVLALDEKRARHGAAMKFLGKTQVYSGGVTIMAAFPKEERFLSADAILLIHSRQLDKTVDLTGAIWPSLSLLRALCHEIELGVEMEDAGYERLIAGSDIDLDEIREKALHNWYVPADEALKRGLIAGIEQPGD